MKCHLTNWRQRIREAYRLRRNARVVSENETVFATSRRLHDRKSSDTLFVLGSGSSINEITSAQWEHISAHDTFGFNFWGIHEFVPTFYMLECSFNPEYVQLMIDMMNYRAEGFRGTPVMVRRVINEKIEPTKRFWDATPDVEKWHIMCPAFPIRDADSVEGYRKGFRSLVRSGVFDLGLTMSLFWHVRGSLSSILAMAIALEYKRVILCGIDLTNPAYFFDSLEYQGRVPRPPVVKQDSAVHNSVNTDRGTVTISDVIEVFNDEVLGKRRIELFVQSSSSQLASFLPVYSGELA